MTSQEWHKGQEPWGARQSRNKKEFGEEGSFGPQKLQAKSLGTRRHLVARVKRLFTLLS